VSVPWRIAGSYFESCNCEAICPTRTIDGHPGGRSTYGVCIGVLSWLIVEGNAGPVDLGGLSVAMATRYSDDEPGSPWRFILYLDARADTAQREALEGIYCGRLGGDAVTHFPWVWKESELVRVRAARIEVSHEPRRQWLRIGDYVSVRIGDRYDGPETVTCAIPGHDRPGEELVTAELRVNDDPMRFWLQGKCGFAADFDYASDPGR
jgi:hypothetical protein